MAKASALPQLPGGASEQPSQLRSFLRYIEGHDDSGWVGDESSTSRVQSTIAGLGYTTRSRKGLHVTEAGASWLESPDPLALFVAFHNAYKYVGELLVFVESRQGARVDEILDDARAYGLEWSSKDQIRRRVGWLTSLGLLSDGAEWSHVITDAGSKALAEVELIESSDLGPPDDDDESAELPPAPPLLQALIDGMDPAERELSLGFKVASDATSRFVDLLGESMTRSALDDAVVREFHLKPSSVDALVSSMKRLGVWEWADRDIVRRTPLGEEWATQGSPLNFARLMHVRYQAVGEVLDYASGQPLDTGTVHRALFPDGGPASSRTSQVMRRLEQAGALLELGRGRFVITVLGVALRDSLPRTELNASLDLEPDDHAVGNNDLGPASDRAELSSRLLEAGTDASRPSRLEEAVADAFDRLGTDAQLLGGPGRTDVLVTIRSGLEVIGLCVVDAKTAAGGQLREDSVDLETLREHAEQHAADRIVVVGPGFEKSGRLLKRGAAAGVVFLTTEQMAQMVLEHVDLPYTPEDLAELTRVGGALEVEQRRRAKQREQDLLGSVLRELRAEAERDQAEYITARDIYRTVRDDLETTEEEILRVLVFLQHPFVAAVREGAKGSFALAARPDVAALRLSSIAGALKTK
ncbi:MULTISPECIES: hypothetical protein [unclassified Frondihabitans]|uniref:hypothetical protein n=1 Tax=unclassified Frondihabitans TaxID=2626248 RepID=UPI000F4E195D|nr:MULTISPECIES: hypothetical protein [unclassified Frondihabitans]